MRPNLGCRSGCNDQEPEEAARGGANAKGQSVEAKAAGFTRAGLFQGTSGIGPVGAQFGIDLRQDGDAWIGQQITPVVEDKAAADDFHHRGL